MFALITVAAIAAAIIAATVMTTVRDGYRRAPVR
ncbi:hypothetical protein BH11ACT3_BH11ACT3_02300 [soil metagenome]